MQYAFSIDHLELSKEEAVAFKVLPKVHEEFQADPKNSGIELDQIRDLIEMTICELLDRNHWSSDYSDRLWRRFRWRSRRNSS